MAVGNSTKIPLTEDDIDGASLRGKTPSQLTIPELKRWLSCRKGAKLSGTKRSLVERYDAALDVMFTFRTIHLTERKLNVPFRVQSYIDGGLDKDLLDPDNGENIARKRRNLGINAGNVAADNDVFMFPPHTAQWKGIIDGRTLLPEFSLANMMTYFVTRKVCDGQSAGDFKHVNNHSFPLFKAGHIQRIRVIKGNDSNVYLSAICLPEMRKDREYKIQVVLSPSAEILFAEDGCPAGKGPTGSCKHIAAFCYALEEFVRLGFTRPFLSCTSRLQTWNQPRQKKLDPKTIYEISFERAEYGKVKKPHSKPFPQDYNAIPLKHRREQSDSNKKLSELCKGLSKPCGFLKVLNMTGQRGVTSVEQASSAISSNAASPVHLASSAVPNTTVIAPPNPVSLLQSSPPGVTSPGSPGKTSLVGSSASPVALGPKVLNPTRQNGLLTTPPPSPSVCQTTSSPVVTNGIFSTPYPSPSTPVQLTTPSQPVTPTVHDSHSLPPHLCLTTLTPPNSLPPSPLPGGRFHSISTTIRNSSMDEPIKLPMDDMNVNEPSIPDNLSEEAKHLFNNTVKVDFDQAVAIESSTRDQSDNNEWFKHRQCRLTASNFGAVLKRKKQDCSKLVERLTNSNKNLNVSSLNYGRNNEDIVANYYLQYQERHGHPGSKLFSCGLVVNPKYSWLGASPDRLVYDPTSNPPYGGLEIKCIESGKGMTPLQTYQAKREPQCGKKKSFCLIKNEDILQLDPNHHYYHQVQDQCGVSGLKWNDFVLMTDLAFGDQGIHVERIYFDETWHETSLPILSNFYFSHILPALLQKP